eukprot:1150840-Pelagomonas_calceolata.AAC.2
MHIDKKGGAAGRHLICRGRCTWTEDEEVPVFLISIEERRLWFHEYNAYFVGDPLKFGHWMLLSGVLAARTKL